MKTKKLKIGNKVELRKDNYDSHLNLMPDGYQVAGVVKEEHFEQIAVVLGDYCGKFPMIGKIDKRGSDKDTWGVKFTSQLGSFYSFFDAPDLVKL